MHEARTTAEGTVTSIPRDKTKLTKSALRRALRELRELRATIIESNCLFDHSGRPRLETLEGEAHIEARRLERLIDDILECLQ